MTKDSVELPDAHFVDPATGKKKSVNWQDVKDDDENDNDEELKETPSEVIAMLGFDPLQASIIKSYLQKNKIDKADLDTAALLPVLAKIKSLAPKLIKAAQKVYDDWQQDDESSLTDTAKLVGEFIHSDYPAKVYDVSNRSDLDRLISRQKDNKEMRALLDGTHLYVWNALGEIHENAINELGLNKNVYKLYIYKKGANWKIVTYEESPPKEDIMNNAAMKRIFTRQELKAVSFAELDPAFEASLLTDTAAKPKAPVYEFYKFTGGRGVALTIKKRGKVIQHAIRTGDVFGVKPSVKGVNWTALITKDLGDGYVFAVPQATLQRILNSSKKWTAVQPKDETPKPMHLLQLRAAWMEAEPKGLGSNKAAAPYYILAKYSNIHIGVNISPADLLLAAEYNEKGMAADKLGLLKHMRPYLLQLNRGLMAMKRLFTARLTKAQVRSLAAFIQKPLSKPGKGVMDFVAAHDRKWKVDGNVYRLKKQAK
jgi:hypothetical protein